MTSLQYLLEAAYQRVILQIYLISKVYVFLLVKKQVPYDPTENEQRDVYLGRLEHEEKPIRDFVADLLDIPGTNHNALHKSILQLFKNATMVRIVTTNYDRLGGAAYVVSEEIAAIHSAVTILIG